MDDLDFTQERMERDMAELIAAARSVPPETSDAPAGECFNGCGTPALEGGNHCSAECAEDFHQRKILRKRQGARP